MRNYYSKEISTYKLIRKVFLMKSFGQVLKLSLTLTLTLALLLPLITAMHVHAAETKLDYPELLVTPRASERLQIESLNEQKQGWTGQLPLKVSAATTLLAGILMMGDVDESKDPDKRSPLSGIVVGAGFLSLSIYLNSYYNAYQSSYADVRKYKKDTDRAQLIRERLAEEHINKIARMGNRLKWLSVATNGGASLYMLTQAQSKSTGQIVSLLALATAIAPLIFPDHWTQVAKEQKNYKKKIYGPLVRPTLLPVPGTDHFAAGALFTYAF